MKKMIHNLRQQPESVRRHLLHIITVVVGLLLLLVWIYTLGTNLSTAKDQVVKDATPLTVLKANAPEIPQW